MLRSLTLSLILIILCGGMSIFAQTTSSQFGDIKARAIGPAVMSGRVSCILAAPSSPQVIYIGTAGGGVFKSNNAGVSFFPIGDDIPQSIGAMYVDPEHPDTLWVGTGESWVRNSVSVGKGVYMTTNGGQKWNSLGLENTERIADIQAHPKDKNILWVAALGTLWAPNTDRGFYRSEDGGKTWSKTLFVDENTGCADFSVNPTNPNEIFAAMWEFRRSPDFFYSGGKGSGLYHSKDGGKSFKKILPKGLPEGLLGRMAIAHAPSNANKIYLTLESEKKEESGLYVSSDGGKNFSKVSTDFGMKVRPFYFSRIVVDPKDDNKFFKAGLNLSLSTDQGKIIKTVGAGVHSDVHDIWVNPSNTKHVLIATDGGAYFSHDGGESFLMYKNLPLSQFYRVAVDDQEPYNVYGGLQDNGCWYAPSETPVGILNSDWKLTNFGDGFYSMPHPKDHNIVYSESQGGGIVRFNKADGQTKDIRPTPSEGEPEYRFNWNTPIHLSEHQADRIYVGCQFLMKSEDRGNSYTRISPDLTTNDSTRQRQKKSGGLSIDNSSAENNTTIYAIAESPKNENVIWVGSDDGLVHLTKDGGKNWTNVSDRFPGLPKGLWCSSIHASKHNENTVFITFDGHNSGDMNMYAYRSTDFGQTFTQIVTNESVPSFARCILQDPVRAELLYLGTEHGLYISLDAGATWILFQNDLPKVAVHGMAIQERKSDLVLATHGRGVYIIDDLEVLRQLTSEITSAPFTLLQTTSSELKLVAGGYPFAGLGEFIGSNPKESANIIYYMSKRHVFGDFYVEIFDPKGEKIRQLPAAKNAGLNILSLPTRLPYPKAAPTNNRTALGGSMFGPNLKDGIYKVVITKGKETFETSFELKASLNTQYSSEDRALQHETVMKLYTYTEEIGHKYYAIEGFCKGIKNLGEVSESLKKEGEMLTDSLQAYKTTLAASDGDFYVDEGSTLIREKISKLYYGVSQFPGKPSNSQLKELAIIEKELETIRARFEEQIQKMNSFNEALKKEGKTPLEILTIESFLKK